MAYRTALVTGATGGIGQALVTQLCADGLQVHAFGRSTAALRALSDNTGCIGHAVNLADTAGLTAMLRNLDIDILVNNAGAGAPGSLASNSAEQVDAQVDVNIRAVLHLSRLALPGMIARNRGHLVMIGSMAGHYAFSGNAAYHATKAAIHMLCRQLRHDLFGTAVRVTEITPGRVETDMFANALGQSRADAANAFFEGFAPLKPADIAGAVGYTIGVPAHVNISHIEILPTSQVTGGMSIARQEP